MSKLHLDYTEYKQLVADNGVTEWTKYNWLSGPENPFFGGFKRVQLKDINFTHTTSGNRHLFYAYGLTDFKSVAVGESIHGILEGYTKSIRGQSVGNLNFGIDTAGNFLICNNAYDTVEKFIAAEGDKYLIYEVQPQYTELQYIESSGTQYIETNYRNNPNVTKFTTKFMITEAGASGTYPYVVRCYLDEVHNATRLMLVSSNNILQGLLDNNDTSATNGINFTSLYNTVCIADVSKTVFKLNDISYETSQREALPITEKFTLFGGSGSTTRIKGRIYSVSIFEGSAVSADFIPVRRNTDNAVGMYDKVSGQFFGNAGTGSFIAGPEKEVK